MSPLPELMTLPAGEHGRARVIIEGVQPEIDGGQFPIKRVVGETVVVEADIYADGHDVIDCRLLFREAGEVEWREALLEPLGNDRWQGEFQVTRQGEACYTLVGWVDPFLSWQRDLGKRNPDDTDFSVNLSIGVELLRTAAARAQPEVAEWLLARAELLASAASPAERQHVAVDPELTAQMRPLSDRRFAVQYGKELRVVVDRVKARYSTWYELFPRSWATEPGRHGTFRDVETQLPRLARMGFDVLYLPPIHPIGRAYRKGKNNNPTAQPGEVGSPWGIGAAEGGHTAIHPELGTLDDFRRLLAAAHDYGIEIALDLAYQCSPDHPWVREHPAWFRRRPDGSIQYAENPPKKYQDIYPIDFESSDWPTLWNALAEVVLYWVEQGVRLFRVDNPHTKAFAYWEWMIAAVKQRYPDVLFLSEAFTRPKIMYRLAKLGFTQSYTYFSWRNTKAELESYFLELTKPPVREFFRPNLWPNTPDILPEYLQWSGRPGFMARFVLAATLGASYGIYGPAFELCVSQPLAPGKEEYLDSEKYEIKQWQLGGPEDLSEFIARVNKIRRENSALHADVRLRFHPVDNPALICYSKFDASAGNRIVIVVNLDPRHTQAGWVDLHLGELKLDGDHPYQMQDLLAGTHYLWQGGRNFVELNPNVVPAHIFRVRQHLRTERDFDYFM